MQNRVPCEAWRAGMSPGCMLIETREPRQTLGDLRSPNLGFGRSPPKRRPHIYTLKVISRSQLESGMSLRRGAEEETNAEVPYEGGGDALNLRWRPGRH